MKILIRIVYSYWLQYVENAIMLYKNIEDNFCYLEFIYKN